MFQVSLRLVCHSSGDRIGTVSERLTVGSVFVSSSANQDPLVFMSMAHGSVAPDMFGVSVIPVRKQKSMAGRRQARARLGGIGAGQVRCEPLAW